MTTLREAAQQALEVLIRASSYYDTYAEIDALRAALEQHEKDVEWMKQRHANWRLQKELAEQTQERDRQQREYEEARSAALEQYDVPLFTPHEVTPPGATLRDLMEERDWKQRELAHRLGRPVQAVNEILAGKKEITEDTALELERVMEVPAQFWLAREAQYREHLARQRSAEVSREHVPWLEQPKFTLSCGCPSQYGGVPAYWARNGSTAFGMICEKHWHEYGARSEA